MALKFKSNVSNEGIFHTAGTVVAGLSPEVEASLIARGLAEQTDDAPTHSTAMASATSDALPLQPAAPEAAPEPVADGFPQHSTPAAPAAEDAPAAPEQPVKHGIFGFGASKGQPSAEEVTQTAEQVN